ncbi:hypothetical protein ACFLYE_00115 [Chloroflexota bacterium]
MTDPERFSDQYGEALYSVLSPCGEPTTSAGPLASRLNTLNGKTICELSTNSYNTHWSFPIIRELLKERYPDVRIIPYTEVNKNLPNSTVMSLSGKTKLQQEKEQAAVSVARMYKCDAVIAGNGG